MNPVWADFFYTFSRFEYAMKVGEFGYHHKRGTYEPDWVGYIKDLPNLPPEDERLAEANHYLTTTPSMKQVGKQEWEEDKVGPGLSGALWAAKTVRNNLFHGGKSGDDETDERNNSLIGYATYILQACARHDGRIRVHYHK